MDPSLIDAHLTADGWKQVVGLHKHIRTINLELELIVVSPMTRTLETATGVFGTAECPMGGAVKVLMAPTGEAEELCEERPALYSDGCPPILACELVREQLGRNPCDKRRPMSELKLAFPGVDFSQVESESDTQWEAYGAERREGVADIQARARQFLEWLESRPEKRIAVVAHSAFLTLGLLPLFIGLPHYDPELSDSMGVYFQNCEMRSYTMSSSNHLGPKSESHPWAFLGGREAVKEEGTGS
mmetsp:Transcript_19597/g.54485  ORF Transcript_19597/g.54485 Transcript_19597/m.54485 type:complete len:244 (+) Transcript_19597:90-821(+)